MRMSAQGPCGVQQDGEAESRTVAWGSSLAGVAREAKAILKFDAQAKSILFLSLFRRFPSLSSLFSAGHAIARAALTTAVCAFLLISPSAMAVGTRAFLLVATRSALFGNVFTESLALCCSVARVACGRGAPDGGRAHAAPRRVSDTYGANVCMLAASYLFPPSASVAHVVCCVGTVLAGGAYDALCSCGVEARERLQHALNRLYSSVRSAIVLVPRDAAFFLVRALPVFPRPPAPAHVGFAIRAKGEEDEEEGDSEGWNEVEYKLVISGTPGLSPRVARKTTG
jgi:hypothetical protein